METWLILLGVLLPLAPVLQVVERRLAEPRPRAAVRVGTTRRQQPGSERPLPS
jgi:hypothetical protein